MIKNCKQTTKVVVKTCIKLKIIIFFSTYFKILNKGVIKINIKIRNVKKEDIPSVVDIQIKGCQTAYKGFIEEEYLNNLSKEYEFRIKKMENNYMTNGFIVAEQNDEVVAFCRYVFNNSFSPEIENADCELCAIYVRPDLKHCGIGTKLFNYVINEFKNKNKSTMILWCIKDNEPSKKFYTKMGGTIITERNTELGNKQYKECCFKYDI